VFQRELGRGLRRVIRDRAMVVEVTFTMANYWLLSSGKDGELWPTFWNEKVVALGWSVLGDLRLYANRQALKLAFQRHFPAARPGQHRMHVTQLWNFRDAINKGELVFVRSYGAIIGIGEVQGDYEFVAAPDPLRNKLFSPFFKDHFPHIRRVRWLSLWGGLRRELAFTRLTLMP
jgi:predicted Mrr-cat superfamily restriction endonuclease